MPTRNHMDITTPPLPMVAPEVLRVAQHRHKKGLMYPYIYHILTKVPLHLPHPYQGTPTPTTSLLRYPYIYHI
ncbi:unnamed protein product, partial [Oncorhynchus mykiss]